MSRKPDRPRAVLARHVASYVGSTEYYNAAVAEHGFAEAVNAIAATWESNNWTAAGERVPERLLDAIVIAGTPALAREPVRSLCDITDTVLVSFPAVVTASMIEAAIETLGPPF